MNTIDKLAGLNIDFGMKIKKAKAAKGSDKFTDKKIKIAGTRVEIKEISAYRKQMKLPALMLKIRQCLLCFDKFHSSGAHNRMCEDCAKQ